MNYRKLLLNNNFLKFGFIFTLAMILVAGLWPFNFWENNEVEWLKDRNGVHFYGQGIIFSELDFSISPPLFPPGPITIEIWLQPDIEPSYLPHILSVYDGVGSEEFYLAQWKSTLILQTKVPGQETSQTYKKIGIANALPKGQSRFITITSDEKGTCIYVDGRLGQVYLNYSFLPEDRKTLKEIILGNSPTGKGYWYGYIYGLAIYQRSLTAEQILQHFQDWSNGKPPSLLKGDNQFTVSYFPFDERTGTRIQDQINRRDLLMLPRFEPPQKVILAPPWKDFRLNFSFFNDIVTNILGFIPFGFFISALLRRKIILGRQPFIVPILLGFFLSFTVELIQVYLPTRNSQFMDVLTNTIGTALGIVFFHFSQSLTTRKSSQPQGLK